MPKRSVLSPIPPVPLKKPAAAIKPLPPVPVLKAGQKPLKRLAKPVAAKLGRS
jgi:hypothetical protein